MIEIRKFDQNKMELRLRYIFRYFILDSAGYMKYFYSNYFVVKKPQFMKNILDLKQTNLS